MAVFKITPTASVVQSVPGFNAFNGDTAGADSLIVDPSAFLMTVAPNFSTAALFANTGAWTVTINGVVLSQLGGVGLSFDAPPEGTALTHSITIGSTGSVSAGGIGIALNSAAKIKNAGQIDGDFAINQTAAGTTTITNSGTIHGDSRAISAGLTGSTVVLNNTGFIDGNIAVVGLKLTNTNGLIQGSISASGPSSISSTGSISESITLSGINNDTISNSGSIGYAFGVDTIDMGGGNDTLTNSGKFANIAANIFMGSGNDTLTNSGFIDGNIDLGSGLNKLSNSGTIRITSSFLFSGDADTISNTGQIEANLDLFGGNDVLTNSKTILGNLIGGSGADKVTNSGLISGVVDLGTGDDTYIASGNGIAFSQVVDGEGNDTYTFGSQGGTFTAIGTGSNIGIDKVTGGTSINDVYDVSGFGANTVINLDSKIHGDVDIPIYGTNFAANTALTSGTDIVKGFDSVKGGLHRDIIFGTASRNTLDGGDGDDNLFGFAGNDDLYAGAGSDGLIGGAGGDYLLGVADGQYDEYWYMKTTDSGLNGATRDTIAGFEDGFDAIRLQPIDADTTATGDQAFLFIGTNTGWVTAGSNSGPGQLRAYWTAFGQMIEGDVNGDRKADFQIYIADDDHSIIFTGADFVL